MGVGKVVNLTSLEQKDSRDTVLFFVLIRDVVIEAIKWIRVLNAGRETRYITKVE